MSAIAGRIIHPYTHVEIDEKGQIWVIQNNFESDSVILEMESSAKGEVIVEQEDDYYYVDYYDETLFGEDYL